MKVGLLSPLLMLPCVQGLFIMPPSIFMPDNSKSSITAGYIGLGAYFDGENEGELRLRQSQPVVMRFPPTVCTRTHSNMNAWSNIHHGICMLHAQVRLCRVPYGNACLEWDVCTGCPCFMPTS